MNPLELLGFGSIIDFEKEDEGMEKEEMIERLIAFRNGWENPKSATPDFWEEVIEAVKVGEDTISRQAAIDACLNGWNKDYKEILADIRELPPVKPEQKWIPVSERLPKIPCIVCDANDNIPYICLSVLTSKDAEHGQWAIDGKWLDRVMIDGEMADLCVYENRITAWMPLPLPYGGENT